mmetsp:Transcript_27212/g.43604  ORF Transcript_27212/g.43604 Transcript_27212/m.43604 type:complete len:231 (-) Transcript_27212:2003-2695(-)
MDGVVARHACLHVIGVQDCVLCGVRDAHVAQHRAVHPWNAGDARRAPRCSRDCAGTFCGLAAGRGRHEAVVWQVRRQVTPHADRAHAGTTAAVRDAEGLVQVQVADICTDHARGSQAQLCVHVGSVHVDLSAVLVDSGADLLDVVLEEGPRGGVGDHQGGEPVLVLHAQGLELFEVHASGVVDPLDLHVAHRGRCRVGAVGRAWDDADVSMALAFGFQVFADHQQTRILA